MAIIALQSSASALSALNVALDVTANNLANVNTAGFKSSRVNFQDLLYVERAQPGVRNATGDERPTGLYVGLGTRATGTQLNFDEGNPIKGDSKDAFIQGVGFFRVQVPTAISPDGVAYTRAGQFTVNSNGDLVMAGDPGRILADGIQVPADATEISIASDGRVFVRQPGSVEPVEAGQLTLAAFINPAGLKQSGDNLFVETGASGPPVTGEPGIDNFGSLLGGYYESSNVDPTTELIDLIRTQRAFEMNSNTIRAADQVLQTVAQLRR
jgi:flagellar basal-body rod protein FlgG